MHRLSASFSRLAVGLLSVAAAAAVHGVAPLPSLAADQAGARKTVTFVSPEGDVDLVVADGSKLHVKKGGSASVAVTGDALTYVVASGERWRYEASIDLQRVASRTITLRIPGMHVRVINRSDVERRRSCLSRCDGDRCRHRRFGRVVTGKIDRQCGGG